MALEDSITAFWKLGEASGNRADVVGSNTLVDNNTVTQADGKVGKAAQFTAANSESLSIADNAEMSTGNVDFAWSGWVYLDSKPTAGNAMNIAAKYVSSGDQREWGLELDADTDRFQFFVSSDGTSGSNLTVLKADNLGSPVIDRWYFIVVEHDATNDTLSIQIDNGIPDLVAYSSGVFDGTAPFELGSINSTSFFNGRIDAAGWWKKTLPTAERTQLFNGGDGLESPFEISIFSQPLEVVTQVCDSDTGFNREMILPRFAGEEDDPNSIVKFLDEQAEIIEDKYNSQVAREIPCEICVVTGSIILDCGKCVHFEVAADADINSISFINCVAGDELDITFRASKDIEISGWPSDLTCKHCGAGSSPTILSAGHTFNRSLGFGTAGAGGRRPVMGGGSAECLSACIKKSVAGGTEVGAAVDSCAESCEEGVNDVILFGSGAVPTSGTQTCGCTPDEGGLLTVSICKALDCTEASPKLELTVCGGSGGYTWSVVGGETPTQTDSGNDDENTKIEPPTNTTPGEPGDAYAKGHAETNPGVCPDAIRQLGSIFNCAGTKTGSCTVRSGLGEMPVVCDTGWHVVTFDCRRGNLTCGFPCIDTGACDVCEQRTIDLRTQSMIDNGCKPCHAVMQGAIVSVTDSSGAVVSTVIETTIVPL